MWCAWRTRWAPHFRTYVRGHLACATEWAVPQEGRRRGAVGSCEVPVLLVPWGGVSTGVAHAVEGVIFLGGKGETHTPHWVLPSHGQGRDIACPNVHGQGGCCLQLRQRVAGQSAARTPVAAGARRDGGARGGAGGVAARGPPPARALPPVVLQSCATGARPSCDGGRLPWRAREANRPSRLKRKQKRRQSRGKRGYERGGGGGIPEEGLRREGGERWAGGFGGRGASGGSYPLPWPFPERCLRLFALPRFLLYVCTVRLHRRSHPHPSPRPLLSAARDGSEVPGDLPPPKACQSLAINHPSLSHACTPLPSWTTRCSSPPPPSSAPRPRPQHPPVCGGGYPIPPAPARHACPANLPPHRITAGVHSGGQSGDCHRQRQRRINRAAVPAVAAGPPDTPPPAGCQIPRHGPPATRTEQPAPLFL